MTKAQIELLKRCIHFDRFFSDDHDRKLVEVGRISGVNHRTAEYLVGMGLLVYDTPSWASEWTAAYVRLPTIDEIETDAP